MMIQSKKCFYRIFLLFGVSTVLSTGMHNVPFSYIHPTVIRSSIRDPSYDAPSDPRQYSTTHWHRESPLRMSGYGYGRGSVPYATGSGAEYMARQGWDRSADERSANSAEGRISFYGKSDTKRNLAIVFCLLILILLAAIVVIILFICGVFRPAISPISVPGPPVVRGAQPLIPPLARLPSVPSPSQQGSGQWPAIGQYVPVVGPPMVSIPQLPSTSTTTTTTTTTTSIPFVDRNENRTFTVVMYIVQQANAAYNTKTSYAYMEAFRMINDAVINLVTTSTIQQYNTLTTLEDLRNSDDDLEVKFRIQLTAPSRSSIDANTVRNVLVADIFKLESRLNQVVVDRNRITVTRAS